MMGATAEDVAAAEVADAGQADASQKQMTSLCAPGSAERRAAQSAAAKAQHTEWSNKQATAKKTTAWR